jgi:hypothetical protein
MTTTMEAEQVRSLLIHLQTIDEEYMFHFYEGCDPADADCPADVVADLSYIREKWVTFRRDQVAWVLSLDPNNLARLLELADQG